MNNLRSEFFSLLFPFLSPHPYLSISVSHQSVLSQNFLSIDCSIFFFFKSGYVLEFSFDIKFNLNNIQDCAIFHAAV